MRVFLLSLLLLFTMQSVASVIEVEFTDSHDQIHHQHEQDHVVADQTDGHNNDHIHFCHHHHGEHNAKVLWLPPLCVTQVNQDDSLPRYIAMHISFVSGDLYRPPKA